MQPEQLQGAVTLDVFSRAYSGPTRAFRFARRQSLGVTLIELLCVLVIIGILMSLLLPTLGRAYSRAKGMSEEWEAPEIMDLLVPASRNYCGANPKFLFESKEDFAQKCNLAPKCKDWVRAAQTEFVPFGYLDPTNKTVLVFHIGRRHATRYAYTVSDLSRRPPER